MGRYGHYVIDADGHGGEPKGWRKRIPDQFKSQMAEYIAVMKDTYKGLPGAGMKVDKTNPRGVERPAGELDFDVETRPGVSDPKARIEDMDEEGIDVAVLYPPGSGEEWALGDPKFAQAVCRTLNDARAEYANHAPNRIKLVAKLPMIDPSLAAEELERCMSEHGNVFVGMVTATHIREKNLDDPSFDIVWETAQRLDTAVCTHGGGQAPGQQKFVIDRFDTRLAIHAITHPVGAMHAVYNFTVGGIWAKFPNLRVGFMEAAIGWLPFWLERLDEHWEHIPEQAPAIDRKPSSYFAGKGYLTTEPEESMIPYLASAVSPEIVCYSSDYYHWDCSFPKSVKMLEERPDLTEEIKPYLFSRNAARLYKLPLPA
ncbi:MAG: hypothetical protein FJ144_06070 [Deltaproteobacteria bacterium]|nr:hypothetical protein [Deltaproteobacteria bacterium]